MRDLMDFCLLILNELVTLLFKSDLGGYSYGDFLVGVLVISIFVSVLVISFRHIGSSPASAVRPSGHMSFKGASKSSSSVSDTAK